MDRVFPLYREWGVEGVMLDFLDRDDQVMVNVFQNHLPMAGDYASAYRGHPALAAIPTTWDDTRCLAGKVGQFIVVARRHGAGWWVGAMGGRDAREAEIPLGFLDPGRFRAEIDRDDVSSAFRLAQRTEEVAAGDVLRAPLAPARGVLIRLSPTKCDPEADKLSGYGADPPSCEPARRRS